MREDVKTFISIVKDIATKELEGRNAWSTFTQLYNKLAQIQNDPNVDMETLMAIEDCFDDPSVRRVTIALYNWVVSDDEVTKSE